MKHGAILNAEYFSRYEFKYLLSSASRAHIEAEVRHFMNVDGHTEAARDDQYLVRSNYFDTADSVNFYEKIDGIRTRRKYRIRTYADEKGTDVPVYLEVKGRHNERTYKERVMLDWDDVAMCLDEARRLELLSKHPETPLVESFVFHAVRNRLKPRILVDAGFSNQVQHLRFSRNASAGVL